MLSTTLASPLNDKIQIDLPSLGDAIVLHSVDPFSQFPLLVRTPSKSHLEVRNAFAALRIAARDLPRELQSSGGGE